MAVPLVLGGGAALALLFHMSGTEPTPSAPLPTEPATVNPLLQREAENSVPGRYDNLPMLQSVYRDPAYAADPGVIGKMN